MDLKDNWRNLTRIAMLLPGDQVKQDKKRDMACPPELLERVREIHTGQAAAMVGLPKTLLILLTRTVLLSDEFHVRTRSRVLTLMWPQHRCLHSDRLKCPPIPEDPIPTLTTTMGLQSSIRN